MREVSSKKSLKILEYNRQMSQKTNNNEIPIEAIELLPWYASGLLTDQEKDYVERTLLKFPSLQEQLKSEHQIIKFLKEEKELFHLSAIEPSEKRLELLLERKELQNDKHPLSLVSKFKKFSYSLISGNMSKVQYIGFASVTTITIALLFAFIIPLVDNNNTFYPAYVGSDAPSDSKTSLLMGLNVPSNDPRLTNILKEFHVQTIPVPGKEGMFRLNFAKKVKPPVLKKLISELSANKELVWFVGEAY